MTPAENLERTRLLFAAWHRITPDAARASVMRHADGYWRAYLGGVGTKEEWSQAATEEAAVAAVATRIQAAVETMVGVLSSALVDFGAAEVASKVRRKRGGK